MTDPDFGPRAPRRAIQTRKEKKILFTPILRVERSMATNTDRCFENASGRSRSKKTEVPGLRELQEPGQAHLVTAGKGVGGWWLVGGGWRAAGYSSHVMGTPTGGKSALFTGVTDGAPVVRRRLSDFNRVRPDSRKPTAGLGNCWRVSICLL